MVSFSSTFAKEMVKNETWSYICMWYGNIKNNISLFQTRKWDGSTMYALGIYTYIFSILYFLRSYKLIKTAILDKFYNLVGTKDRQSKRKHQKNLPRELDKIYSGFTGFVAIWVTHPLWPLRVPFSTSCSVMMAIWGQDSDGWWIHHNVMADDTKERERKDVAKEFETGTER